VQPTLLIQELQTIKLKQHNSNYIKFINVLCDDCHKQAILISESHNDSNRCTPYRGKSDQHATRFPCSVGIYPSTICISRGPRIATFCKVINNDGQSHCSQQKGLLTQSTARQLTDPWVHIQFLSWASHWHSGGKATLCWYHATRFTGPI
jgi:hypothetical protein